MVRAFLVALKHRLLAQWLGAEICLIIIKLKRQQNKTATNTMKKVLSNLVLTAVLLFAAVLMSSCASTYKYCQIYETKPLNPDNNVKIENGQMRYEYPQCVIEYDFWANGGSADFTFYNKTDDIICIDLAKSFFIQNGVAYDIYQAREWSHGSSVDVATSAAYGYGVSQSLGYSAGVIVPSVITDGIVTGNASKSKSRVVGISESKTVSHTSTNMVSVKEKQIVAVPPRSKKRIETYKIVSEPLLSCDLQRYPQQSAQQLFSSDDSPCSFSDVITFRVGDNPQLHTINNEFYVSSVTNYAEPEIITMKKRDELCENMKEPDYTVPNQDLYDKYVKDSICETASSFYKTYETTTQKKLYNDKNYGNYTYNVEYGAYVKAMQKGNPVLALVGFGGFLGVAGLIILVAGL